MENLHQIELNVNLFLQSLGDWLFSPMRTLSFLGDETFFIFGLALLYWSIQSRLGLRVGILLVLSIVFNTFFKVLFAYPRPFWIDNQVTALITEESFGFPSGHAQNSTAIWGLVAKTLRKSWVNGAVVVLVLLVGISRLYLGVHFLSDVIGGWLLGLLLLMAYDRLEPRIVVWLRPLSFKYRLSAVLLSGLGLLVFLSAAYLLQSGWQIPAEWIQTSAASQVGYIPDPLNPKNIFTLTGIWLGMLGGVVWFNDRFAEFNTAGSPLQRILRFLLGLVGLLVIQYGLGALFPGEPAILGFLLRLIRYALLGAWVSAVAPAIFHWTRLVQLPATVIPAK